MENEIDFFEKKNHCGTLSARANGLDGDSVSPDLGSN